MTDFVTKEQHRYLEAKLEQAISRIQRLQADLAQLKKEPPLILKRQSTSLDKPLDIAVLFSDPLVSFEGGQRKEIIQPVSYYEQIRRLRRVFRQNDVSLKVQVATIENMSRILQRGPEIVHIICHGQNHNKKIALCFQSSLYTGQLKFLNESFFMEQAKNLSKRGVKILFINACYSQSIAKIFLQNTNIPYGIAVMSQQRIMDQTAYIFSTNFYQNLMLGISVRQSFKKAVFFTTQEMRKGQIACCCAHGHSPNCKFTYLQSEQGLWAVHEQMHIPSKGECKCSQGWMNKHSRRCRFAINFLSSHNENYLGFKEQDFVNFQTLHACCCFRIEKEHYYPHDQSMKFKLLVNPNFPQKQLFFEKNSTYFVQETNSQVIEMQDISNSNFQLMGRNLIMDQIIRLLKSQSNCLILQGVSGSGRTSVLKRISAYLLQRNVFNNIVMIDCSNCVSLSHLMINLLKPFDKFDMKDLMKHYKNSHNLFLFDNFDGLIKDDVTLLLQKMIEQLSDSRFILTLKSEQRSQALIFSKFKIKVKHQRLPQLRKDHAAKLFIRSAKHSLQAKFHNYKQLMNHKIFKLIELQPKLVLDLAQNFLIKQSKHPKKILTLNEYTNQLQEQHSLKKSRMQKEVDLFRKNIESLKEDNQSAYALLSFLSQFRNGLSYMDIVLYTYLQQCLEHNNNRVCPSDWQFSLLYLTKMKMYESNNQQNIQSYVLDRVIKSLNEVQIGDYYYISVGNSHKKKIFTATQFVRQYFNSINSASGLSLKMFPVLTSMASITVRLAQKKYQFYQKLIEFSGLSNSGFWSIKQSDQIFKRHFQIEISGNLISLSPQCDLSEGLLSLVRSFGLQNQAQLNLMNSFLQRVYQFSPKMIIGTRPEVNLINWICDLSQLSVTLLKHQGNSTMAINLSSKFLEQFQYLQQWLRDKYVKTQRLAVTRVKLALLKLQIQTRINLKNQIFSFSEFFGEAKMVVKALNILNPLVILLDLQLNFLRVFLLYKELKMQHVCKQRLLDQIILISKRIQQFFIKQRLIKTEGWKLFKFKWSLLKTRILIQLHSLKIQKQQFDASKLLIQLISFQQYYRENQFACVQISTLMSIAKLKTTLRIQLQDLKEKYIERLKYLLKTHDLKLVRKKIYDKVGRIQSDLTQVLEECAKKLIIFSRSSQLSDRISFRRQYNFKSQIESVIRQEKKQVLLKFQILTRTVFEQIFKGCFLAVLYFQGLSLVSDQILLENDKSPKYEPLNINSIDGQNSGLCDIIFLIGQNVGQLGKILISKFRISNMFLFQFSRYTACPFLQDLKKGATNEACREILRRILKGDNQQKAFNSSISKCIDFVIENSNGLVNNSRQFQKQFGRFHILKLSDSKINQIRIGQLRNVSAQRPVQPAPLTQAIIRRNDFVGMVIDQLSEQGFSDNFINVWGSQGSGKSTFAKQLKYQLSSKFQFKQGIHIIECRRCEGSVKGLIQNSIGCQLSLLKSNNGVQGMLVIFDDFQNLLLYSQDSLFNRVFQMLFQKQVQILFITRKNAQKKLKSLKGKFFKSRILSREIPSLNEQMIDWMLKLNLSKSLKEKSRQIQLLQFIQKTNRVHYRNYTKMHRELNQFIAKRYFPQVQKQSETAQTQYWQFLQTGDQQFFQQEQSNNRRKLRRKKVRR